MFSKASNLANTCANCVSKLAIFASAAANFVFKSATGIMLLLTGFVLQFSGFIPNQPQTMEVKIALISLYGLVPLIFYSLGAFLLYKKFKFGEKEHAAIKSELVKVQK